MTEPRDISTPTWSDVTADPRCMLSPDLIEDPFVTQDLSRLNTPIDKSYGQLTTMPSESDLASPVTFTVETIKRDLAIIDKLIDKLTNLEDINAVHKQLDVILDMLKNF